jgi:hypothetical protein
VQFAPETARALERVVEHELGFQDVNSIFGEGPSPRLRKLRTGLALLGFNPETLLKHNQHRLIYAVDLAQNARPYLRGETDSLPEYLAHPERFRDTTERIAGFWRERWLARRLDHTPTMETLALTKPWKLSDQIPSDAAAPELRVPEARAEPPQPRFVSASPAVEFWRSLAFAGPEVCSDELSADEIERLHVQRPLEDFLVERIVAGTSLVLTGNAGDGKTHLLRRLQQRTGDAAVFEFDATAAMRRGELAPVLDQWRAALVAGKPYCLAANEYPLYELRTKGLSALPLLAEVDRQCRSRLAYGHEISAEDARDNVLVVDLSLRNPLAPSFSGKLLEKLLADSDLQAHARTGIEPNFSQNFDRLATHARVRERVLDLFRRLVIRGARAPVRELWIMLARLLFGSRQSPDEVAGALSARYSERLFEPDDRFRLSQLLREVADPAACSHPQWDARLEEPRQTRAADWLEGREPSFGVRDLDTATFSFLKRVFYFEHADGAQAFALEENHARRFSAHLADAGCGDPLLKREIMRAINLCYCPRPFRGMEERLHLWIGHRFHEQPTRSWVANQSVSATEFEIVAPRLPRRLAGALDYERDHFLLRHAARDGRTVSLRIDSSLFATLSRLREGLPRHLVPDRDVNRLDAFIEQLQTMPVEPLREFVAFNAEHRLTTRIRLSADGRKYVEVKDHE